MVATTGGRYDVDNSGTIDVDELEAVLKDLLDLRLDDEQWRALVIDELRKRDVDENGARNQSLFSTFDSKVRARSFYQDRLGTNID
jgi:Ca2+-binding EF-hand superfamily protein